MNPESNNIHAVNFKLVAFSFYRYHLKKVTELAKQKDTMTVDKAKVEEHVESEEDIDEDDLENMLMDWRGKQAMH